MGRSAPAVFWANVIIWVAVIVATTTLLQGTEHFAKMLPIVGGGSAASIIVNSALLRGEG